MPPPPGVRPDAHDGLQRPHRPGRVRRGAAAGHRGHGDPLPVGGLQGLPDPLVAAAGDGRWATDRWGGGLFVHGGEWQGLLI